MAIDFYNINDAGCSNKLFSIELNDFDKLDEILSRFKKMTGVYLDPYGTIKIYPGHVDLIKKIILESLKNKSIQDSYMKELYTSLLHSLGITDDGLLMIGD